MQCTACRRKIMQHMDGALNPEQDKGYTEHLRSCRECQALEADLLGTLSQLHKASIPEPLDCEESVMSIIRMLPKVQSKNNRALYFQIIAVPIWLLILAALFNMLHFGDFFYWLNRIDHIAAWVSNIFIGLQVAFALTATFLTSHIQRINHDLFFFLLSMTLLVLILATHSVFQRLDWKIVKA